MGSMILTPVLRNFVNMTEEERDALKGTSRVQYYYRLHSRVAQAIEDLELIIEKMPKEIPVDFLMNLLQRRLRVSYPNEGLVIRIEFQRPRR